MMTFSCFLSDKKNYNIYGQSLGIACDIQTCKGLQTVKLISCATWDPLGPDASLRVVLFKGVT